MEFRRRIYGYCERGFDPGPGADAFWAEPLNAITNGAFILAAILGLIMAIRARRTDGPVLWLVGLTFIVGIGSFLFHTYAMVWAAMTDTIPILLFILSYFAIAMRCYAGFGWGKSILLMLSFLVLLIATSTVLRTGLGTVPLGLAVLGDTANENYLRQAAGIWIGLPLVLAAGYFVLRSLLGLTLVQSVLALAGWFLAVMILAEGAELTIPLLFPGMRSYLPALMALGGVGLWLWSKGHGAGHGLMIVAAIFAVSLTARALDRPLCATVFFGTHWAWHLLNGIVLGSLIVLLIRHGRLDRPVASAHAS